MVRHARFVTKHESYLYHKQIHRKLSNAVRVHMGEVPPTVIQRRCYAGTQ
jgi:hypothetical protein